MSLRVEQGVTYVTGNARLARHLRWHADRQNAANESAAWLSADVLSWNAWLERLWRDALIAGGAAGCFDLLTDQQSRLIWQKIVSERPSPELVAAQESATATSMLMDAWRLSRSWDIPLDVIRQKAIGADSEAFARWAVGYAAFCRERQWIDSAMVPDLLVQDLEAGHVTPPQPIVFAGFDQLTPQQARLQAAIKSLELLRPLTRVDRPQPRLNTVTCLNQQHEFELAARWSRRLFDHHEAGLIGVLVPGGADRQARRVFLDVLMPDWRGRPCSDLPVRLTSGRPLGDVGLIHIALLMLELPAGGMNYRQLGQLLRTPYIEGGEDEATQRAALEVRLRDYGLQQIDLRGLGTQPIETQGDTVLAPDFRALLQRACDWNAKLQGRHEPAHWAGHIARMLQDLGWSKGRSLTADEQQMQEAWNRLLDAFAACSPMVGSISFVQARRLLTAMAREQRSQPDGRMDGVHIMTAREAAGHSFDGLWICGLSSDAWPPMPVANPLIPLFLQREHGVPDASPPAIRKLADRSMAQLLESAPVICASWPQRRGEEELVASPVLDALVKLEPESMNVYDEPGFREQIHESGKTETLTSDPAPALQHAEKVRGGSRLLKMQAACPARAFFEARLGATELPVPPHGLDARTRGIIMHDAAAHLYTQIAGRGALSAISDGQIDVWIDESADRSLRAHLSARHPLGRTLGLNEKRRMQGLLRELIAFDRRRADFSVESMEQPASVELGPLALTVRQDRIDRIGDGGRFVIDYKTGRGFSYSAWRGARPAEPQLPLYAATTNADGIAIVVLNQDGVTVAGVAREELNIDGLQSPAKFLGEPDADWDTVLGEWETSLAALAREFAGGDCRINRLDSEMAAKDFAMLTRIHDRSVMYLIGGAE